jgi:hypothetical protein
MGERESNNSSGESLIGKIKKEFDLARGLASGYAPPEDLFISEHFPELAEHAPEKLELLRSLAEDNLEINKRNLKLSSEYPEAWYFPDPGYRNFLLAAAVIGRYDEAFDTVKAEISMRIEEGKVHNPEKKTGFEVNKRK